MSERVMTILAGPSRKLPDRRAHEIFEDQARARPDAIATVHGSRQLTYGEVNARANKVARGLLARGLTREGVVGVVTERNLDWMVAVSPSLNLILRISHLPRRVPPPPRTRWDILSLHEKGFGGEH